MKKIDPHEWKPSKNLDAVSDELKNRGYLDNPNKVQLK